MLGPPPGDLLDPGIEPRSLALQADSLLSEPPGRQTYKLKEGKKYGERAICYYRAVNKGLIVKVIFDQRPVLGEGATLVDFGEASKAFSNGTVVKNLPANEGNRRYWGLIPGLRVGNGNSLQYSYLENSMDRGASKATVYVVPREKKQSLVSNFS